MSECGDRLASFFLVQNSRPPDGVFFQQDHTMPYDCELLRVWGNIGASLPDDGAMDLLIDVTRARDGLSLGHFRDDHYGKPVGVRAIDTSVVFSPGRAPIFRAGDGVTTVIRCASASGPLPVWASAFFAVEFTVWRC